MEVPEDIRIESVVLGGEGSKAVVAKETDAGNDAVDNCMAADVIGGPSKKRRVDAHANASVTLQGDKPMLPGV